MTKNLLPVPKLMLMLTLFGFFRLFLLGYIFLLAFLLIKNLGLTGLFFFQGPRGPKGDMGPRGLQGPAGMKVRITPKTGKKKGVTDTKIL